MKNIIKNNNIDFDSQIDEYRTLFDLVPCIITVQDKNYRILKYNHEFSSNFDAKEGEYCFKAYKDRKEKCFNCPMEKTFIDGNIHFDEQIGLNKDKTIFHWILKTAPIKNSKGEVIAAIEMSIDITRQKQLQEQLEKSEKKYYAIFNNIPNCIFVIDSDTLKIRDCNDSVEFNYGYKKKELINKLFTDLFMDKDKTECASLIKTKNHLEKIQHKHKDGSTLFTNIRISLLEYQNGNQLIVSCTNITDKIETEQQLIQASKLTTLGEMATGVAHELNQPLSVIKTASTFIMQKNSKNEQINDDTLSTLLKKIDNNVDKASDIINHMRQFSRKSGLNMEKIQINDVVPRAFQIFHQQLKIRGIKVIKETDQDLPVVIADPNRLEQVFINLILNARDAIEEKWGDREDQSGTKKIIIKTYSDKKHVFVEVIDTGTGINDTIAEKIFEPFYTTKEVGKGTGIGLSISYGIIKDCGGIIYADMKKKDGAAFVIKFPIKDNKQ
ncbi:MAG: PAS domain S-box protein [Deltaproteobacteria bacterium]|jgi:histidine kinase|nr:PAS domain S-box protein [Deltaproteobacteria bacterium]